MDRLSALMDRACLEEIINGIPHGIALVDRDGLIAAINHFLEALSGYDGENACGQLLDQVVRTNLGVSTRFFQEILAGGERIDREGNIINVNRKIIPVRITVSPLHNTAGNLEGFLFVLEDISLQRALNQRDDGGPASLGLIGCSQAMQELFDLLPVLSHSDTTLLITGETGTGKDLLAESIHKASKRAKAPFIKVNCGALPETLLESELFGHVRGAFTGAHTDKQGMFRLAQGGTIFLTEIGDLPLPLQVKLLTVLDDREFFPVGGSKKVKVDVRLITGTHRDLPQLVREGKFREDLFFRLNVLRAHIPALRERGDDIKLLLEHFLRLLSKTLDKNITGFDQEAEEYLCRYHYPGNVRELRNIIEYAVNICQDRTIKFQHLPVSIHAAPEIPPAKTQPATKRHIHDTADSTTPPDNKAKKKQEVHSWSEFEKQNIFDALVKANGNRTQAALLLGWWRSKLLRKIKFYGLD